MSAREDLLVWVDIETFGLDLGKDPILEVGFVVTDLDLNTVYGPNGVLVWDVGYAGRYQRLFSGKPTAQDVWVRETHNKNKLLDGAMNNGVSNSEAELELIAALKDEYRGLPMVGSSAIFDRTRLAYWMPKFEALFHYRTIDISSVKELCKRYNPEVYAKLEVSVEKREEHRVVPDLKDSIHEAGFYIDNFLFRTR